MKVTSAKFPEWADQSGVSAAQMEAWVYKGGAWQAVPFQVDEVSRLPMDVKPFIFPGAPGTRYCVGQPGLPDPGSVPGPCEFLYDLRGTSPPSGALTTNDEVVFIAGMTGACDAPTTSWPDPALEGIRYRIQVSDTVGSGAQTGCVYLFRRTTGTHPTVADLISYDPIGDGVPAVCLPGSGACGAIVGQAVDIEGDQTTDLPSYRLDFYGNWTIDKWFIGETTVTAGEDLVDIVKWRIEQPHEQELMWDLYQDNSRCGNFNGYIDGAVRVIRPIQGAASGGATRKLEFAYPGETLRRVYLRVHDVLGPIHTYPDLMQANVSAVSNAKVFKSGFTAIGEPYDEIDGAQPDTPTIAAHEWYQVSSTKGSFFFTYGQQFLPGAATAEGAYADSTASIWNSTSVAPEWDSEVGDRGAARTLWKNFANTQNFLDCTDPVGDNFTGIFEQTMVMLSSGFAASNAGELEDARRRRGVLSQCVEREFRDVPSPPSPGPGCAPAVNSNYGRNGGAIELSANLYPPVQPACTTATGWNLYQVMGGGVLRRLATLGLGDSYSDITLALNEQRTYRASALRGACTETVLSEPITIVHDDIVAPPAPGNVTASTTQATVTVAWTRPAASDVVGYKVLVGTESGGPYSQAHSGLLGPLVTSHTFQAAPTYTYYVVVTAIDHAGNESPLSSEVTVQVP